MGWNDRQLEAIRLRDRNILVSAAAGSGKTAVLVERIRNIIADEGVDADRLLVVTFTNAAAAEMKERLIAALSEEIASGRGDGARLRNQLDRLNTANISTFHAFAMEVIRRYFYLTDTSPDFRICDEAQKSILQASAMEELLDALYQEGRPEWTDLLDRYSGGKNDQDIRSMISEVHRFIQSLPDPFAWLEEKVALLDQEDAAFFEGAAFAILRQEIADGLANARSSFTKARELLEQAGVQSLIPKSEREVEKLADLIRLFECDPFDRFADAVQNIEFETFRAARAESENYEPVRELVRMLRDKGKDIIRKRLSDTFFKRPLRDRIAEVRSTFPQALMLCDLVYRFDQYYRARKKEKNLLDFSDIEHYALEILRHPEAAAEYREKFIHIFIDEYQDSNIVQESLIDQIRRENNVFMVGDVKQSIYKFRLAEPELFIDRYERYGQSDSGLDERIDLNLNYRSKGGVIRMINSLFGAIMHPATAGIRYDEAAALNQGVTGYPEALDHRVELCLVDAGKLEDDDADEAVNELKKAELEAMAALSLIRECIGQPIFDMRSNTSRPIDYSDIVILMRSAKGYADVFQELLMQEGIPAYADIGEGYFDTMEIGVFLNLLRVIDNKRQDIPLISVLRSPVFGFSTNELAAIRVCRKGGPFYRAFEDAAGTGDAGPLGAKCAAALRRLGAWKTQAAFMTLEELLWMLLRETGYYDYIGAIPGGVRRQANMRALIDKAAAFQRSHLKGMFGFINYIEMLQRDKVATGQATTISERDNVVRIMTVHKSKGLEFPVVLACGLGKRFNRDQGSYKVSIHKNVGIGLRYVDPENGCYVKTLVQSAVDLARTREGIAEEIRILYVAMTRAMDRLFLVGTAKNASELLERCAQHDVSDIFEMNSFLEWILTAADRADYGIRVTGRSEIRSRCDEMRMSGMRIREKLENGFEADVKDDMRETVATRLDWEYPHAGCLSIQSKFSVSEITRRVYRQEDPGAYDDRPPKGSFEAEPQFTRQKGPVTAAELGTAVHLLMEHLPFDDPVGVAEINAGIDALRRMNLLSEELADAIDVRKIHSFFRSGIGRRACRSAKVVKEASFNMLKNYAEIFPDADTGPDEPVIIQGTIDCYFEEADGLVLVDFKTDRVSAAAGRGVEELAARYRPQLRLYKEALEAGSGGSAVVREAWLYLFDIDDGILVDL